MEKFTYFWNGQFSQWHYGKFKVDGLLFTCCEQYMMYKKAELFGDKEIMKKVMLTKEPRKQKRLGRLVKNFNKEVWEQHCKEIVYDGNYAKFTQNPNLNQKLKDTKGTTLVEASPYDPIWGIGLEESDPRAKDRSQWLGTNWLGEVLTKLRIDLFGE